MWERRQKARERYRGVWTGHGGPGTGGPGAGRCCRWGTGLESSRVFDCTLDTLDNGGERKRGCGSGKTYPLGGPKHSSSLIVVFRSKDVTTNRLPSQIPSSGSLLLPLCYRNFNWFSASHCIHGENRIRQCKKHFECC